MLDSVTKSLIIKDLIRKNPNLISKEGIKTLITDPDKAMLSIEDGSEALNFSPTGSNSDAKVKELHLDVLPNMDKLDALVTAARHSDIQVYKDFTQSYLILNEVSQKISSNYNDDVNFLLDELKSVNGANKEEIDKLINAKTDLMDVIKVDKSVL
jgi:cobalamin biosynthesis Mg chelatase CobN